MAAQSNGLSARIRQLEAAEKRAAALPAKTRLSFKPMQELLAVSRPVLTGWCSDIDGFEASGAFVRGGNGIEWEFNPRKTVAYLLKHHRGVIARQTAKSQKIAKAVGVTLPDGEESSSLAETRQMIDLTLKVTEAQERQGRYIPVDEVSTFLAGYNEEIVSGLMGTKTKVDPNGNLPPAVRKAVDEELRRVAALVHDRATKFIGKLRGADLRQGGVG